jgi:hypothetical protein
VRNEHWTDEAPEIGKRYRLRGPCGYYGAMIERELDWNGPDENGEIWNSYLEQMWLRSIEPLPPPPANGGEGVG